MSYEERPDRALRFGDVVEGFVLSASRIDDPPMRLAESGRYQIEVERPRYCAVMTPCCSLRSGCVAMSPLQEVLSTFFENPCFEQDLTRINRLVRPQDALPPERWRRVSPEEQQRRLEIGPAYTLQNYFIFAPHDLLPPYTVSRRDGKTVKTNAYMVDFHRIHRVQCKKVTRPEEEALLATKVLQLSVEARSELRDKLTWFFGRIPDEDDV